MKGVHALEDLTALPNIGAALAEKLKAIGITSYDELVATGSVGAVLKIGEGGGTGCYNMLYALEGAIQGVRWHSLSKEEKARLRAKLDMSRPQ